jgi:hypothetical protein
MNELAELHVIEERLRLLLDKSPALLGAMLSELNNGHLHRDSPEFLQEEAKLAQEFPGLLSGTLRILSWLPIVTDKKFYTA